MKKSPTSDQSSPVNPPASQRSFLWQTVLLLGGTLVLTLCLFFIPSDVVARLGRFGYVGVFVLTLLSSASIVLPSPALGVAALAGKTLNPWVVGLVGGVAAGLGEITGYMAGRGGHTLVQRSRWYSRVETWVQRWGVYTIFVLAFVPGPGLDLAGIAAGTLKLPFRAFLGACVCGKVLRFLLVAWLGRWLGDGQFW